MPLELSLEDLTPDAQSVLEAAAQAAGKRSMPVAEPIHILLALLEQHGNLALKELTKAGVEPDQLAAKVKAQLPALGVSVETKPPLSQEAHRVVRFAFKEATHLGHRRVDALHLLLGLFYLDRDPATTLLTETGVSLYQLRENILATPKQFNVRQRDTLSVSVRPSPIFLALVAFMFGNGALLWLNPNDIWAGPLTNLFVLSGWVVSLCLHEFGHALAAYLGGDTSVKDAGYLTLNPLRYTHPLLSIVFPLIFLLMGGIGLPGGAVYIRTGALRNTWWEALVSAAGPLGTLFFCLLLTIPFYFNWWEWIAAGNRFFWPALAFLGFLQVTALLFNLLPIPPLDGFNLLATQFSPAVRQQMLAFGNLGFFLLLFLFSRSNPLSDAFWRFAFQTAAHLQIPVELVGEGYRQFAWWSF